MFFLPTKLRNQPVGRKQCGCEPRGPLRRLEGTGAWLPVPASKVSSSFNYKKIFTKGRQTFPAAPPPGLCELMGNAQDTEIRPFTFRGRCGGPQRAGSRGDGPSTSQPLTNLHSTHLPSRLHEARSAHSGR